MGGSCCWSLTRIYSMIIATDWDARRCCRWRYTTACLFQQRRSTPAFSRCSSYSLASLALHPMMRPFPSGSSVAVFRSLKTIRDRRSHTQRGRSVSVCECAPDISNQSPYSFGRIYSTTGQRLPLWWEMHMWALGPWDVDPFNSGMFYRTGSIERTMRGCKCKVLLVHWRQGACSPVHWWYNDASADES